MGKRILHLDFETRSDIDLRKSGLAVYCRGKHTDILCAAFAFDDEPVRLWLPSQDLPTDLVQHIESGGAVWAHNAAFEKSMCNNAGVRRHGWPVLYDDQLVCTMAMAYAMALPATLDGCSSALGIDQRKDLEGARIMMQLCQPRSLGPNGPVWWDDQEKLERLYKYCIQDVEVERAAGKRMLALSSYERQVWRLDQKINERGVKIDVKAAFAASQLVEEEKVSLDQEMRAVSGGEIASCQAVAQIKAYLAGSGMGNIESIDKASTQELLAKEIPADCRRILELRAQSSKASTAKIDPMISGVNADHRLRGSFQYSGANTRRWAGRRVQLHNLKRPSLKHQTIEKIVDSLREKKMTRDDLSIFGDPLSVVGDLIRALIVAEDGKEFLVSDFSAIEARVVAWLAGQESVLEVFRSGTDIYIHAASSIFGKPAAFITKDERAVGKVAILALGFGGGVGAFQAMAKGYGVKMAPAFEALSARATEDQIARCYDSHFKNKTKYESKGEPISQEEYVASDLTKIFWREDNEHIVSYWAELEQAAISAVTNPNIVFPTRSNKICYKMSGSFLFCRLPGGGVIVYPYPEIRKSKTPWGSTKDSLTYMAEDSTSKKWTRFTTFGGSLCENVTQAVARDLLADAMLRCESKGLEIVMHVHDEIVCEVPKGQHKIEDLTSVMNETPTWAKGLPISSSGFICNRYRK